MTDASSPPVRVAAVQATPVFLDRDATLQKACDLIATAGSNGARLAVFPEGFIPTYPFWAWFVPPFRTRELRELYDHLLRQAVTVPGPAVDRLADAARDAGVTVVMGINEVDLAATGTTLYTRGLQVLAAPTWDRGEPWTSTLRHIGKEGRAFVIGCCSPVHRDDVPDTFGFKRDHLPDGAWINPGGSAIVDPDGKFLVEPVTEREDILYADLDLGMLRGSRFQLDVAGHYHRPDVFEVAMKVATEPWPADAPSEGRGAPDDEPVS